MDLLADVLSVHGYTCTHNGVLEGRSGSVYTIPLLAEKDDRCVVLDACLGADPLPASATADIADVMHDVGAHHAVICHDGVALSEHAQPGVSTWGHEFLWHVIGEAMLARTLDLEPEALRLEPAALQKAPVANAVSELMPTAFQGAPEAIEVQEEASQMPQAAEPARPTPSATPLPFPPQNTRHSIHGAASQPDPVREVIKDILERPRDEVTRANLQPIAPSPAPAPSEQATQPPAPAPAQAPAPVPTAPSHAFPLLPVRLTPQEAAVRVRGRMDLVDRVLMILQPVHLIDYECDLLAEGSLRYDTLRGRLQIHGTDKTVGEVDAQRVDPDSFSRMSDIQGIPAQERTMRVSDDRARHEAARYILDAHTRVVDVQVNDPDLGYSYTEKKPVSPRPDHIRLRPIGAFHRVIWRCIGPGGQVDVDGLTGDIVEESLRRPHSDAMLID